jgi:hypothetical protein
VGDTAGCSLWLVIIASRIWLPAELNHSMKLRLSGTISERLPASKRSALMHIHPVLVCSQEQAELLFAQQGP